MANLSRNVIVESADPAKARGHTMYHRDSAGSVGYAEFRHLGKERVLGRYSLHYHLVGDTMRGSSVIGASIWDSGNRWLTIHGTNYLVVRDCVGYQSMGHGFFMEDGTEVSRAGPKPGGAGIHPKTLPKQVLPYDKNDGSGFWWANSLNSFTRNIACECDEYGYFFQATKTADFNPVLSVRQPDGAKKDIDIRTLPFVRFEANEAHCQRRHAFNLGGGVPFGEPNVGGVGPDARHPFVIRNTKIWNVHWAFHPVRLRSWWTTSPSAIRLCPMASSLQAALLSSGEHCRCQRSQLDFSPQGTQPKEAEFPKPLDPVDDLPPTTVITHVLPAGAGQVRVRGTTTDNGIVTRVLVNGKEAKMLTANFAEWEIVLDGLSGSVKLTAHAEDKVGNVEKRPHSLVWSVR